VEFRADDMHERIDMLWVHEIVTYLAMIHMYTVAGQGHRNFNFGCYMIDDAEEEMNYEDENDAEKRQEMDYEDDVEEGHS